jgi:hypothetical protein
MTRTRIVVPTAAPELSAPHFDDEATIVTARPVVPIAQARAVEKSRFLLWMLPTALAAAVFGGLSALGVNYYEKRQSPITQLVKAEPQTNQAPTPEPQSAVSIVSEPAGGAVATESATPESESSRPQTAADQKDPDKDSTTITSSSEPSSSPAAKPSSPAAPDYRKNGTSNDPARLVRKRRVHPVTEATPPESRIYRKNRSAGRIQDIFEGPNRQ